MKVFIFQYFNFHEQFNFMLTWVEHEKSFITTDPGFIVYSSK